jgi:4-hydroxy-2-oxoheptanedioate aldolase
MRLRISVGLVGLAMLGSPALGQAQGAPGRLNPMIALHEQGKPVFGISHPAINAGRGGGGGGRGAAAGTPAAAPTPPPAPPVLADVARETAAYKLGDYMYTSGASERFFEYMRELRAQGASMKTHPFMSKVPRFAADPQRATAAIHNQLNAGQVGIMMVEVSSADELRQGIAAMRFVSKGGTRPETNLAQAAAYWGLTEEQYKQKADVWPLNPNGELIVWAIIESPEGLANLREIAAVPGLGVLWAGAGTLGGVFSTTNAQGQRVRDQAGFDAAVASILSACREFRVACGYPASNPTDIERLMAQGWNTFVMQSWGDAGREAVLAGRRLSQRATTAP